MTGLIFTTAANAGTIYNSGGLFGSIGYLNENLTRTTTDNTGKISLKGSAYDYIFFVGYAFPGDSESAWTPRLGYTFLPRKTADTAAKVEFTILSLPYVTSIGSTGIDYMLGTSYFRQAYKGEGGTVASVNGGSAATYYEGDYDHVAQYMTVDLGLGYNAEPMRLSLELFILSLLSDKRSYDLMLNFTYSWGKL